MTRTHALLRDLIAFPTVSSEPNRALIEYCRDLLERAGASVQLICDDSGQKANLYATIGPQDRPGVMLSGHTDVVPVEGQAWTLPPFEMTERDGAFHGRGTADMKGFVACALAAAERAARVRLNTPLHLALSYDEEVGCIGVRSLIDRLKAAPFRPLMCIVGEPTLMRVATGHKGKTAARVCATGREGHSALAPEALNAIHMACDMIGFVREIQADIAQTGAQDAAYDVPYTTLHVGTLTGGVALNIVPNHAEFMFEIRNLAQDNPGDIMARLSASRDDYLARLHNRFPEAQITIERTGGYPGLETDRDADVVQFVQGLTAADQGTFKVAFGTEGGLFSKQLDVPTVVCGPGSMAQGHKPDEFVTRDQLAQCDAMMDALLSRLETGL